MKNVSKVKKNIKEGVKTITFLGMCFLAGYGLGSISSDIYDVVKKAE
jgi:hypothetical protein